MNVGGISMIHCNINIGENVTIKCHDRNVSANVIMKCYNRKCGHYVSVVIKI